MISANRPVASQPTPPEVMDAINTIADYCKQGRWVEAIIAAEGGASFNLTSVYDLISAAPGAYKAFIEIWEKSLQLEKTDVALRMAKMAIEKVEGES